jgi:xanthine/CO dehydrogenase XdhC/CoxF family maturation factor
VLATVVKVTGSAYRRPGARMIFPVGAAPAGVISGGCLEGDLQERVGAVLESGQARVQVYDMRSPDDIVWGLGLGCNGEIRVLLERLDPGDSPELPGFLAACRERRAPGTVATVFSVEGGPAPAPGERLLLDDDGTLGGTLSHDAIREALLRAARECLADGRSRVEELRAGPLRVEALVEYLAPTVSLQIFGAGSDARPLVRIAKELGWEVAVLDNRAAYATPGRFPEADSVRVVRFDRLDEERLALDARTPVVIMTHHFLHDRDLLRYLLPRQRGYLGLLGPRKRAENLLAQLRSAGELSDDARLPRLHGPVGLDIGAETPEEIALAIVAEIQASLAGRRGGYLEQRDEPLHDWPQ